MISPLKILLRSKSHL